MVLDMVSTKDIALVGGLGILVFLVTRAGRDLAGALGNINLPSIGDISFPEIKFPEINIPNPFQPQITENDILEQSGATPEQAEIAKAIDANLNQGIPIPQNIQEQIDFDFQNDPNRDPSKFQPTFGRGFTGLEEDRPLPPSTLPVERPLNLSQFANEQPRTIEDFRNQNDSLVVQSEINDQQFQGGGISFDGGVVRETPIENLSLGQIIDRFDVGATEAADIRARASNDFGNFDFGTNTGSGIGSVVTEDEALRSILPNNGAVSNPEFEGLSAQEIAQRLTGGVISNF